MRFMSLLVVMGVICSLLAVASATESKTLVIGAVYDPAFSQGIESVALQLECNNNESNVKQIFLSESYFTATFDADNCPSGSVIDVYAYKRKFFSSRTQVKVHSCDESSDSGSCGLSFDSSGMQVDITNIAIANINLAENERYGGNGNLLTIRENDTNQTISPPVNESVVVEQNNQPPVQENQNQEPNDNNTQNETEAKGLPTVTGSFLTSGASSWLALFVVLAASLIAYFLLRRAKQKSMQGLHSMSFY
jgi:hypothetical protein